MYNNYEINNNCNFGTNYGMNMNNMVIGSVTISRPKSVFGCALNYNVYIDNIYMGKIKNGETVQYNIGFGQHIIEIQHGTNKGKTNFIISENQRNLVLKASLKLGIFVNKIKFEVINFYN